MAEEEEEVKFALFTKVGINIPANKYIANTEQEEKNAKDEIHEMKKKKNGDDKAIEVKPTEQKAESPPSAATSRESKSTVCLHS